MEKIWANLILEVCPKDPTILGLLGTPGGFGLLFMGINIGGLKGGALRY